MSIKQIQVALLTIIGGAVIAQSSCLTAKANNITDKENISTLEYATATKTDSTEWKYFYVK